MQMQMNGRPTQTHYCMHIEYILLYLALFFTNEKPRSLFNERLNAIAVLLLKA